MLFSQLLGAYLVHLLCNYNRLNVEHDIENCLKVLRNGGIILYPTDTIWGLGCDATNPKGVSKIYALKERPETKSMIVLLADEKEVLRYVANPEMQVFDYLEKTTRPTTVIYEGAIGLAENLIENDGSVGIRIVKDEFCRHLVKRLRKPLVSTSANISGEASPRAFSDISSKILNGVDYIVKYRQEDINLAQQSSIIKWDRSGNITIIRP